MKNETWKKYYLFTVQEQATKIWVFPCLDFVGSQPG